MTQIPRVPPNSVPPSHCRVIGKIVDILPVETSKNDKNPCSKKACKAHIKIIKILGTGAGFHAPLAQNKILLVNFAFTLGATNKLFPELNQPLPGLQVGNQFQADIQMLDAIGENSAIFKIYTYQKK